MTSACLFALALSLVVPLSGGPAPGAGRSDAPAVFERLRKLEGEWEGRSSKGWTERVAFRTIAGGSVVLETSFDAHPGETMATVFALDGDRLLLTHYCVARNQPRLVASRFQDDGRSVMFAFLDAGNLPSRDRGHMDSLVLRFEASDRVTEQWTWFQDGKERWMEKIELTRVPAGGSRAPE